MPNIFEDFEWGNDGDNIDTSGGTVTWGKYIAGGTSSAKIDTGQAYRGTRSLEIYRDGVNVASAWLTKTGESGYSIKYRFRKTGTAYSFFRHGDGTNLIQLLHHPNGHIFYSGWNDSGGIVPDDTWVVIELNNINFTAATFDLWFQGAKIVPSAAMLLYASAINRVQFDVDEEGTTSIWIDEITVRNWPLSGLIPKLLGGGLL